MENLTRESIRGLGITDEKVIDEILNARSAEINKAKEQETLLKRQLEEANGKSKGYDDLLKKYGELEKKNMTAEELQAQALKEAEATKKNYSIMANKLQAKQVLMEAGIGNGETLDTLVSKISNEDEASTIEAAKLVAKMYNQARTDTELKVKAELLANNPKPDASNAGDHSQEVTKETFNKMSYEEMAKFATEHPDEFAKM